MTAALLILSLSFGPQALACMGCASRAGEYSGDTSFVPMGPDGKPQYHGSRYEKAEVPMTQAEKDSLAESEKKKATEKSDAAQKSKAKGN